MVKKCWKIFLKIEDFLLKYWFFLWKSSIFPIFEAPSPPRKCPRGGFGAPKSLFMCLRPPFDRAPLQYLWSKTIYFSKRLGWVRPSLVLKMGVSPRIRIGLRTSCRCSWKIVSICVVGNHSFTVLLLYIS